MPPPDIRRGSDAARYPVQLMDDPSRAATRLELMLENASIKRSVVASSQTTVAAQARLNAAGRR